MSILYRKLTAAGKGVTLLLTLSCAPAVFAADAAPARDELDPLQRSWPEVHATRDGAPADWREPVGDTEWFRFAQADRLELGFGDHENTYVWDAQGWIGGDWNKLWVKAEGEGVRGESPESAEIQALYSRTLTPFWDLQAGGRYDVRPDPGLTHAVIGVQGLAPQWFEVDAAAFLSDRGDATFRAELEYELLLSQRLILQPRFEVNAAAQDVPELGLGAGVNNIELGARLRYEIRREFAPYVGVSWSRKLGDTADLARADGGHAGNLAVVAGLRLWF